MKKFIGRIILFLTPVALFLLMPVSVLWFSGESLVDLDKVAASEEVELVGFAYNEDNYQYFKISKIEDSPKKSVVALGSSRVLQFRDEMFDSTFYNAGFTVSNVRDFLPYLKVFSRRNYPDYLIISLDQWMFNPVWDSLNGQTFENTSIAEAESSFLPDTELLKKTYEGVIDHKISLNAVFTSGHEVVGLNAVINGKGFRQDGSMDYGNEIDKLMKMDTATIEKAFSESFTHIDRNFGRFKHADSVSEKAINELERFLSFCDSTDIEVIGFLPPFADSVYSRMIHSGKFKYLDQLNEALIPAFEKHHFEYYDFSKLENVGSSDLEAIDGFHGGEVAYLRLLSTMLQNNSVLNNVADSSRINDDLKHPFNRYRVYNTGQ